MRSCFNPLSRWDRGLARLLLSLAPIFGSIIAWIFFGEILTLLQITGIVLALAGIGWVVTSHKEPPNTPHGHTRRGVIFGVLAGLGQAIGLVLSKQGMFGEFSSFQANAIRMLAAVIFIWVLTAFESKVTATFTALREKPQVFGLLALGALPWTGTGRFCIPACGSTCRNRCGKHAHGAAARDYSADQLFRVQGKDWVAGDCWDATRNCWSCNLIPDIK